MTHVKRKGPHRKNPRAPRARLEDAVLGLLLDLDTEVTQCVDRFAPQIVAVRKALRDTRAARRERRAA